MSIRLKLIIVCTLMIFVSASLLIFSSMGILANHFVKASEVVLGDVKADQALINIINLLADLKAAEKIGEEALIDKAFIEDFDQRLQDFNGRLYVLYDGKWINVTDAEYNKEYFDQLIAQSHNLSNVKQNNEYDYRRDDEGFDLAFSQDYLVNDKKATYYFVLDISDLEKVQGNLGRSITVLLLFILLIAVLPIAYILSKDVIKPLQALEAGANRIREGDLSFELKAKSSNEIGKVITAFDKMRLELKKSIEQQLQYEENRKELISCISHDLKTPITSIKGYVQGIMDGVADDKDKLARYLQVINSKSQDMDRLIDDLFMFSKLDLDHLSFNMTRTDFKRYLKECINELVLEYRPQGINIAFENSISSDEFVYIDQQMIKRVILNIVQNAVKFMDKEEKCLIINATATGSKVTFCIGDNGIGIAPEKLPYIFDKFYRVDEARNTLQGGSGLGLAIAKHIIEKHGGQVFAKSELGKGTTICFTLNRIEGDVSGK